MVLNDRDGGARCLEEDEDETILGLILDFIAREEEAAAVSSGQGHTGGHTGKPHCKRKAPEPSNPQLSGIKRWRLNHTKSDWWKVLQDVRTYDENCRNGLSFRRRFRVPRVVFDNLLEEVIEAKDENGVSVFGPKGPGPPPIPVNILLLGVLRFLALGCPWDVIEELSHVSETVLKGFYNKFVEWYATFKYKDVVCAGDWRKEVEPIFNKVGFPGCVGSMDAVHLAWEKCPYSLVGLFTGKEGYPTVAFNVIANHTGRIMHSTQFHPGARNDKTIVRYDEFVTRLRTEHEFTQFEYTLKDDDKNDVKCRGAYVIADGGYHRG